MKLQISKSVFSRFDQTFMAGFVYLSEIDTGTTSKESIHLLHDLERFVRLLFQKDTVKNHHLISPWVLAQQEFGSAARHYHTSVEKLIKKILKGKDVATKSPILNVVRFIALKHIVPFAVLDPHKVDGNITASLASGKEKVSILKSLHKNALYFKDKSGPIITKLDYWHAKRVEFTKTSASALIQFAVVDPMTKKKLQQILTECETLLNAFCGGKSTSFILDEKNSSFQLNLN